MSLAGSEKVTNFFKRKIVLPFCPSDLLGKSVKEQRQRNLSLKYFVLIKVQKTICVSDLCLEPDLSHAITFAPFFLMH
jgi:hypothetical protein